MSYFQVKSTPDLQSFILTKTNYSFSHSKPPLSPNLNYSEPIPRNQSLFSSKSYLRSLRRAFARAKLLSFFNPDLNQFITLTYSSYDNNPDILISDMKKFIKKHTYNTNKQLKYIYVMELQEKRLARLSQYSLHIHMICNNVLRYHRNSNGYLSVTDWDHGFSNVQLINDFDENFKPYLYLFKYMYKTERIGKSFIHTSRNFDKITTLDYDRYIDKLADENILFEEDFNFKIDDKNCCINKKYYKC